MEQACSRDALGDAGAPSASTAAAAGQSPDTTHTQPHAALPCSPPAAPASGGCNPECSLPEGGDGESPIRTTLNNSFGPGKPFQDYVLSRFGSTVPSSALHPWVAGEFWVSVPFPSPCFSSTSMESILSFFLCDDGARLPVTEVAADVFHAVVAAPAVASFIVRLGAKHCSRFALGFHASLSAAISAASSTSLVPPTPVPRGRRRRRPKPTWSRVPPSAARVGWKGLIPLPRSLFREPLEPTLAVASGVPSPLREDASAAAPLPPYCDVPPPAPTLLEPSAPLSPAASHAAGFNALPATPRHRSYLDAARSPPLPSPKTPVAPFKNPHLSLDGCFRCLSSLHQIRDCRNPIRCRACGRSGHRLRECTMPFPQPTFVPTTSTPRATATAAVLPRRATPYPSALLSPLSPSTGGRRARSSSPPRRMGSLFEVGESSSAPSPRRNASSSWWSRRGLLVLSPRRPSQMTRKRSSLATFPPTTPLLNLTRCLCLLATWP
ncbi:hypothetical protein ACQ4PT_067423 [Festuca glaucescens]